MIKAKGKETAMIETQGFDYGIARSNAKRNAMHYSARVAQMRKNKADRKVALIMVAVFIAALIAVSKINCYYTVQAKVVATENGVTTFEFSNGEQYDAFTEGDFAIGDKVIVTIDDNGTDITTDDVVVKLSERRRNETHSCNR